MSFKITTAPDRTHGHVRSLKVGEFISVLRTLKPGKAIQVTAEDLGWPKTTRFLTSRISHTCAVKGIKVCTETQADGSVKVWPQTKRSENC